MDDDISIKVLYIGSKLSKHGFTPSGVETLGEKLAEICEVTTVSNKKNIFARFFQMFWSLFRGRNFYNLVLIDTYSSKAFFYAIFCSIFCRFQNIKYIPILRGGNLPNRLKKNSYLSKQIFKYSFLNISPSIYLRNEFENYDFKVTFIPNFIDIDRYPFLLRKNCAPTIFWVRSLHEVYNPKMAIYVLYELLKDIPDSSLCMVGPDKDGSLKKCKNLSKRLGISNKIKFTGILSKQDWIILSKQYDIFINTTNYDNHPVSVIEAMALGLPIISTNAGSLSSFHKNGIDALIVEKNDYSEMKNKIVSLLTNKKIAKKLSNNSRSKAEKYDWGILKNEWLKIFSSI